MATLRLEIKGDLGAITARALQDAIAIHLRMLKDYDRGLSSEQGELRSTLEWVVTGVGPGSVVLDVRPESQVEGLDVGPDVVRAYVEGWARIEHDAATPPFLTDEAMRHARKLTKLMGNQGVSGLAVVSVNGRGDERVDITPKAAVNIAQLLSPARRHAIGSVEGRVETVSIRGSPRCIIYHSRTKKAITCVSDDEDLLKQAAAALGRRILVRGVVYYNARGEPVKVAADGIRVLRERHELPTTADLAGSDPDFTGGVSAEEFLRQQRSA